MYIKSQMGVSPYDVLVVQKVQTVIVQSTLWLW